MQRTKKYSDLDPDLVFHLAKNIQSAGGGIDDKHFSSDYSQSESAIGRAIILLSKEDPNKTLLENGLEPQVVIALAKKYDLEIDNIMTQSDIQRFYDMMSTPSNALASYIR